MSAFLGKAKDLLDAFTELSPATHASSIAYFMFLSVIPLITLSISLVTMTGLGEREIAEFLCAIVPDAFDGFVRTLVGDAFNQSGVAFSLSTIALLITASQGVQALCTAFNAAYGVSEKRNPVVIAAISVAMVAAVVALVAGSVHIVFGSIATQAITRVAPDVATQGGATDIVSLLIAVAIGVVVIAVCYTFLPSGPRSFARQLPGAAIASVACGVLTAGFRVYVDHFCNFKALYGSLSTVALFLFWMFIASYILIACAFLNRVLFQSAGAPEASESE